MSRSRTTTAGIAALAAALWLASVPVPTFAQDTPTPDDVRRLIDEARYVEALAAAQAHWFATPESTVVEAEACDLFLEAARRSGRVPLDRLLAIGADNLDLKRVLLGDDDPRLADTWHEIGNLHHRADDPQAAAAAFETALGLRRSAPSPDPMAIAGSLLGLANARLRLGALEAAGARYRECLQLREQVEGSGSVSLTWPLNGLGLVAQRRGAVHEAESLFRRALEQSVDPDLPDQPRTALVARNLGRLLVEQDRPLEALAPFETAVRIRRLRLASDDLQLANILFDLGSLLHRLGDLSAASALVDEALSIRLARLPEPHPAVENTRWELATIQAALGSFSQSAALLDTIEREWTEPVDAPQRERLLGARANLRNEMGDYVEARALYERLLRDRQERLGRDHLQVATTLHNLSEILRRMGEGEAALAARERAVDIQRASREGDDLDLAMGLSNLADLRIEAGALDSARALLDEADALFVRAVGEDSPLRANFLLLRARCDEREGRLASATTWIQRAVALREQAYGPRHAEVAWALDQLARVQARSGDRHRAHATALRAAELGREHLRLTAQTLDERTALRFAREGRSGLDNAVLLLPDDEDAREATWDALVRGRSLVLDALVRRRRGGDVDSTSTRLRDELNAARRRLVLATTRGGGGAALHTELRRERERAERALALHDARFRAARRLDTIGGDQVRAALEPDEALVSLLRVAPRPGSTPTYAAFVVRRDAIFHLDLGDADSLDARVDRWRAEVRRPALEPDADLAALRLAHDRSARALHRALWEPLEPKLAGARRVTFVPDGSLHLLNPAALVDAGGHYLAENDRVIRLLATERDRVASDLDEVTGSRALVFGGADFGRASGPAANGGDPCRELSSLRFDPLPLTAAEARSVAAGSGDAILRTGSDASEVAFRTLAPGRRWLHLATHGWFLGGECRVATTGTRGIGGVSRRGRPETGPVRIESPLLQAGLALAGANQRNLADDSTDDGLLTAEEIAALDLRGVEAAVLSACDTGLGAIEAGEGVLGLRRAFRLAGVRTLVLSLWPIQDEATLEWMDAFYRARRERDLSAGEAVALAQRRFLNDHLARRERDHPFFWAAFVATGDLP